LKPTGYTNIQVVDVYDYKLQ